MFYVTRHAIERYIERVEPVDEQTAMEALSTDAIRAAAAFGATYVRLATGQRVVLKDNAVITVQPSAHYRRQIRRISVGYVKRFKRRRHELVEDNANS